MTVTVTRDTVAIANSDTVQQSFEGGINPSTVFVFTFSNGTQIAVTGYEDQGTADLVLGVPTPSGGLETVNLLMYDMNNSGAGSTFNVHAYSGGSLGSLLYTFSNSTDFEANFQFIYNISSGNLSIDVELNAFRFPQGDGTVSGFTGTNVFGGPACYLRGTRILTAHGEVAVESLQQGDLVATRFGGLRPVRWIGTQNFIGLNATGMLAPVCIRAGALGPAQPRNDLWVSPGHAVLVEGQLVCAYLLVNGTTIVQPPHTGPIAYFHIDLGTHDCVLAEGAWSETYYEHLNRDDFDNADSFRATFPDHAPTIQPTCLPYVNQPDDPTLPALRAALPAPQGMHLLADGQPLVPQPDDMGGWRFHLPAGLRALRLHSPAAIPHATNGLPDHRRLGLRLRAATLSHDGGQTTLDLASAALSDGWHGLEADADGPWRWTDGDAEIPAALLGQFDAPATLCLHGYSMPIAGADAVPAGLALAS